MKIAVLSGDGIGPEITKEAVKVLKKIDEKFEFEYALVGGSGYEAYGNPLPDKTIKLAKEADAILFGAVGDWKYDKLDKNLRPEQAILSLRKELELFANFRPIICYKELAEISPLKKHIVLGIDLLIIRELTGGIYFGNPRGIRCVENENILESINTMRYSENEIKRIAHIAFQTAQKRKKKLTSIDKANVLETSQLWRSIFIDISKYYLDVSLHHMYVDNAAMQIIKNPKQFDVIVTENMFGDILSDEASVLTGSIGMMPSASFGKNNKGLYEPSHGSAPDISGKDIANPLSAILSAAMLVKFSMKKIEQYKRIENAIKKVLFNGYRTFDIFTPGLKLVSTSQMGDLVIKEL